MSYIRGAGVASCDYIFCWRYFELVVAAAGSKISHCLRDFILFYDHKQDYDIANLVII